MQLIGEATKLQFAVLCIGDNYTLGVDDALRAAEFVRCDQIQGVHHDTWPIIALLHDDAINAFRVRGKTLHPPAIGDTINL